MGEYIGSLSDWVMSGIQAFIIIGSYLLFRAGTNRIWPPKRGRRR